VTRIDGLPHISSCPKQGEMQRTISFVWDKNCHKYPREETLVPHRKKVVTSDETSRSRLISLRLCNVFLSAVGHCSEENVNGCYPESECMAGARTPPAWESPARS